MKCFSFDDGWVRSNDGKYSYIKNGRKFPVSFKELIFGGGMIAAGTGYLLWKSFKNGFYEHSKAYDKALVEIGAMEVDN